YLQNLQTLTLRNLRFMDNSLKSISMLSSLKHLNISNQFETSEYAYLAAKMPNTQCELFQAYTICKLTDANQELVWDRMVTGKRKPLLLSSKDGKKLEKYVQDFDNLKSSFT